MAGLNPTSLSASRIDGTGRTPPSPAEVRERQPWLDYAKGIGIILVVLGHANQGVAGPGMDGWSTNQVLLNGLIYSFHMPLFFMLAGYSASLSARSDTDQFLKGLFWSLVLPYLVWSIIWISLKAMMPDATTNAAGFHDLLEILWDPVEHLWFLYALFFIRTIWFIVPPLPSRMYAAAVVLLLVCVAMLLRILWPETATVPYFLENLAFYGIGFAGLGIVLAGARTNKVAGAVFILAGVVWLGCVLTSPRRLDPALIATVALLGSAMVISLAHLLPAPRAGLLRLLALIGEASLVIYVLHLFFTAATRWLLDQPTGESGASTVVLSTLAGVFLPLAIYIGVVMLSAKFGTPLMKWLALGQTGRSHYLRFGKVAGSGDPTLKQT